MATSDKIAFAVIALGSIAIPGFADYVLSKMGYHQLAFLVWAVGFGSGVFVIWYVCLRHVDFSAGGQVAYEPDPKANETPDNE